MVLHITTKGGILDEQITSEAPSAERVSITVTSELAAYFRRQAVRELRSLSGMLAFALETYRQEHPDD